MKKRILGLLFTVFLYLGMPNVVYAAGPANICELEEVIVNLFNLVIAVTPFIGLAILIYGAVLWITAAADPQRVQLAQSTLTYGVVGMVLGLSAILIVVTIESFLLSGEDAFRWSEEGGAAFVRVKICADDAAGGGGADDEFKSNGEYCLLHTECVSCYCDAQGQCYPHPDPGSLKSNGEYCSLHTECASCFCNDQGQCYPR